VRRQWRTIFTAFITSLQEASMDGTGTGNAAIYSSMIRGGKNTYFVDVREAKNGKKYLSISETHIDGEEKKRATMRVFSDSVEPFRQAVEEAVQAIAA
jgi:hypothetical protein